MCEGDLIKEFVSADEWNSLPGISVLSQDQVHIDRIHLGNLAGGLSDQEAERRAVIER
jgi:hypothetical protein